MVTMEVNLKEGDKEPEQHLDEGEFIERRIVPLTELYSTLQGKSIINTCCQTQTPTISCSAFARKGQDCRCQVSPHRRPCDIVSADSQKDSITGHSACTGAVAYSRGNDVLTIDLI